jgi:hypothetical protein
VRYPVVVHVGKRRRTVKSGNDLVREFDRVFHAGFREKIKSACVCNMFVNSQGVMLGGGWLWIDERLTDGSLVIIAINN